MSRHSLPLDRTDAAAADTASTKTATTQKSTAAFFYPPLTPPATSSNQAMSQPLVPASPRNPPPLPPHPYQAYASGSYDYHAMPDITASSHTHLSPGRYPSVSTTSRSTDGDAEKASHSTGQPTYIVHHHHHHHHLPPLDSLPASPRHSDPAPPRRGSPLSALRRSRPLLLLVLFLPFPPALAILYLLTGHAILRRASPSPAWSAAPLLSTTNAGATGGAILSLPLFLLLFILLFPAPRPPGSSPTRTAHEDFFDDDDDEGLRTDTKTGIASLATYVACAGLVLGVGGAAGALGVTCLGKNGVVMLSPGKAAEAGIVGGLVLWAGLLVVAAVGAVMWVVGRRMPVQGAGESRD